MAKIKLKQYRPAFISTNAPLAEETIETYRDLIDIDWVANWAESHKGHIFHRFSVSSNYAPGCHLLMAEFNEGRNWNVIGMMNRKCKFLPEWKPIRDKE